jgi:molybdopterin-guanine dinucleotide biosynthesis protein A
MTTPDVSAFVLAGGQSTRMGRDKALLPLAGQPLLTHALAILHKAGLPAAIAGARSDLGSFAPVIPDQNSNRSGPLAGLCAALASTSARHVVFLSVDAPLLPPSLLTYLVHHTQVTASAVTLASVNGIAQTFPAILDRAVLPSLERNLAATRLGCLAAFRTAASTLRQPLSVIPAEYLLQAGQAAHPCGLPPAHWFLNLNAPADLEHAERLLARPCRPPHPASRNLDARAWTTPNSIRI